MPHHRTRRARSLRWSISLGTIALLFGGIALLLTNAAASAQCVPEWSQCPQSGTTTSGFGVKIYADQDDQGDNDQGDNDQGEGDQGEGDNGQGTGNGNGQGNGNGNGQGQGTTTPVPPGPPDNPGGTETEKTGPDYPTAPDPGTPEPGTPDTGAGGVAPGAPPGGGPPGGGPGPVPTPKVPGPAAENPQNPLQQNEPAARDGAVPDAPAVVTGDPSDDSRCLLGVNDSGGCAGADVARDLAPAGLLVLGALALLGSGSFLESLRGSLRS